MKSSKWDVGKAALYGAAFGLAIWSLRNFSGGQYISSDTITVLASVFGSAIGAAVVVAVIAAIRNLFVR